MKVLHLVESFWPDKNGMSEVVSQLSKNLFKLGVEVHVVCRKSVERKVTEYEGVIIHEFDISGNAVNGINGGDDELQKYYDLVFNSEFDIISCFASQQWSVDLFLERINESKARKVFIPTGFSGLHLPEYSEYFERMKSWVKHFDCNIFLSFEYQDYQFCKRYSDKNVLIPNGASREEFKKRKEERILQKLNIASDQRVLLTVGGHTGHKGHTELYEMMKSDIIKDAVLIVVGKYSAGKIRHKSLLHKVKFQLLSAKKCPHICRSIMEKYNNSVEAKRNNKKIIVTTLTRGETVELFKAADLFIFPSNIECSPIVLFEAMAAGLPFLVSDVGNSPEVLKWSSYSGAILPTVKNSKGFSHVDVNKSIKVVGEWLEKDNLESVGEVSRAQWEKYFTWEKISESYFEIYQKIIKGEEVTDHNFFDK